MSPTNSNLTLNGNITGNGTIWKTGAYSVFLGGDNSGFSGTFSHRQSNLYFTTANAGSPAASWDITGGGQLGFDFNSSGTVYFGSFSGTTGTVHGGTNRSGAKTVEIGALNTSTSYAGTVINYQTTNGGSTIAIVKKGTGTLTLSGNSSFSAGARLEAGTLQVNHNSALGSGTITLAGGKLQSGNSHRTLSNALVAATGTTSELVSPTNSNLTLNGNITGDGTIWKTGAYSVFLGGDNSGFNGTFSHRQSNLYFNNANAGSAAAAWDITGGNNLGLNFAISGTVKFGALGGTTGILNGGANLAGAKTVEIGALNTSTTYSGTIKDFDTTNGGSTITLVKKGTGTLTLGGSTTYTGTTTVTDGGTLTFNNPTSSPLSYAGGKITIEGASTLRISGSGSSKQYNFLHKTIEFDATGGGAVELDAGVNFVTDTTGSGTTTIKTNGGAQNRILSVGSSFNTGLAGHTVAFDVAAGISAEPNLLMAAPMFNGGAVLKSGSGTMELAGSQTSRGQMTVSAGVIAANESATWLAKIVEAGGKFQAVIKTYTYIILATRPGSTSGTVPIAATNLVGKTFTLSAEENKNWITSLTSKMTTKGVPGKWQVGIDGAKPVVKWEDWTDDDYNDWYNDIAILPNITFITPKDEADCPCACGDPATQGDAAGTLGLNTPTGDYQGGTTSNIQKPYHLALLPSGVNATSLKVSLTIGGSTSQDYYYSLSGLRAGDQVYLNQLVDTSGEASGGHDFQFQIAYLDGAGSTLKSDTLSGHVTLVNREASVLGNGWWRDDLDQLIISGDHVDLVTGTGGVVAFYQDELGFQTLTADSDGLQLTQAGSNYYLSDKSGNVSTFDSAGYLLSKTTATGLTTTYQSIAGYPDLLDTVTAPDGDVTTYTYETYASGTKWRVATMIEHSQSLNSVTTAFTYNSSSDNLLTQTTRTTTDMVPVVRTQVFGYDPTTNLLTGMTDPEGNTTTVVYDFAQRVSSIERSCGGTTALESFRSVGLVDRALVGDSISNLAPLTLVNDSNAQGYEEDERGNPRWFKMNGLGQTVWEKDALGNDTSYTYDNDGNVLSRIATDPDGAGGNEAIETLFTYDTKGNRLTRTERTADGHVVLSTLSWTYDADFGAVTSHTDELGRVTKYVIGALGGDLNDDGRVLSETRIVGLDDAASIETDDVTTTFTYGSVSYGSIVVSGLLTSVTDANGHTTSYEYYDGVDPSSGKLGLLQKIINPDLTFRTFDYDAHGNRTSETDELDRTTTYSYDGEDRLTGRTDPDPDGAGPLAAPTWSYEYDGNDNQTRIIDPLGRETIMVYNNRTWLAERIEEGGITTSYTYNCVGDMVTMTDPLGRVTTYAYDDLNRQISVTLPDPDGAGVLTSPVTSTTYDNLGRTLTTTDANGNVTTYGYDQHGFQTTVTLADPDGAGPLVAPVYTSTYDNAGQLIASIDPLGRTTTYEYDDLGRQVSVTMPDPDGVGPLAAPVSTTTYDKVGNVLTRTDALGNDTTYAYDDRNRTTSVTMDDPDGAGPQSAPTMLTVYDDAGQVTSTTDALGRVTTYTYDDLGRRITVTMPDPDGAGPLAAPMLTTTYDIAGQVLTTTDALGNVTSYEYDDLGHRVKTTQPDPDGAGPLSAPEWITVYDDASQVTSTTDPLGRTTSYEYDNLGRTIAVTQPDPDGAGPLTSPVTSTTYDANGNVLTSTDALGNVTSYTYDSLNRRTHTTQADPDGAGPLASPVWETVYDIASQVTASIDPLGRTTSYEYDGLGRQTKVTSPDPDGAGPQTAAFTVTTYDAVGNVLTTEDALGHTTSYEYDNLYRLISSTNANLEETSFTYDLAGNRLTLTDPNNNTTTWEYDDLNRVVSETNELNKTRTYVYDVGGRLTSKVDRLGREVEYVYDNLNRVVEELWDSVSAYTWTYDAAGQVLTGGNAATREYVYSYDDLGRVTQIDTNEYGSSSVYDLNWTYDANGNVLTRSHAANTTDWTYDALNRATDVSNTGTVGTYGSAFGYNAAGQVVYQRNRDMSVSGGIPFTHTDYGYDESGLFVNIAHQDNNTNLFAYYGYTWDAGSRITSIDFLNGVYDNEDVDYGYDDAGQVISADRAGSGTDESYDYDDNGNRDAVTRDGSTASWGVGTNNQLTSDGTNSYTYDDEGNLLSDGTSTYYWDHRNRLIEVHTGSTGVMYTYDVNNLRVGQILDLNGDWDYADPAELDTQTSYYFDGGRMVREVSADGTIENNYTFGVNAQLIAVEDVANDVVEFAYNDHLGTVRDVIVVDAGTAVLTEHNAYDSFGRVVERQHFDGTVWNVVGSESIVSVGYTGEFFDNSTGLQYNWNRWYNANTGRWISEDPIGFEGGDPNFFRYVTNHCIDSIDFDGLIEKSGSHQIPATLKPYSVEMPIAGHLFRFTVVLNGKGGTIEWNENPDKNSWHVKLDYKAGVSATASAKKILEYNGFFGVGIFRAGASYELSASVDFDYQLKAEFNVCKLFGIDDVVFDMPGGTSTLTIGVTAQTWVQVFKYTITGKIEGEASYTSSYKLKFDSQYWDSVSFTGINETGKFAGRIEASGSALGPGINKFINKKLII